MSKKKVRMTKMILGAYLVIIGILLCIDVYDQKPSNMQIIFIVASIMIIVGFLYLIQDLIKAFEKSMKEKAEQKARMQEEERIKRHKELHSSDKFRTAPMPVIKPVKLAKMEEELEEFDEETIIVTDYGEEKVNEPRKTSKDMEADKEHKNVVEKEEKEELENQHNLSIDMKVQEDFDEEDASEELAINIEVKEQEPEEAQEKDSETEKEEE